MGEARGGGGRGQGAGGRVAAAGISGGQRVPRCAAVLRRMLTRCGAVLCTPGCSVLDVMELMVEKNFRHVPVVSWR